MRERFPSGLVTALLLAVLLPIVLAWILHRGRRPSAADRVRRRRELQQQLQELAGDAASQLAQLEARRMGEASSSLAVLEAAIARAEKMQAREGDAASVR